MRIIIGSIDEVVRAFFGSWSPWFYMTVFMLIWGVTFNCTNAHAKGHRNISKVSVKVPHGHAKMKRFGVKR